MIPLLLLKVFPLYFISFQSSFLLARLFCGPLFPLPWKLLASLFAGFLMFGTYTVRDCRGKCVVLHWKLTPHPSHSDKNGLHLQKDSDAIFNYSETSRTHLTLIVFLAEIVDVFLQFNLWEKIIWCIFVLNFPFSGLFCLFLPICLLIKCEIKYTCIATSPWDDPLLSLC